MTNVLCLVPARGGSKGIHRKNLLRIAGKPLVAYSIAHALGCKRITRTICSTDDEEIATVAREFGAEVPFLRPAEYATDLATDYQVFKHALEWLQAEEGYKPDLVVHLRPTDPVRKPERIDAAIELISRHGEADSLRSMSVAPHSPYKMWKIEQGYLQPLIELEDLPEAHSMPRQILPPAYVHVGYVDVIRPRTILELESMVGRVVLPYLIDEPTFDLDYAHQIAAIERALGQPRGRPPEPSLPLVGRA